MGKRSRPRTEKRERDRELRRSVREREKLAAAALGGGPDRPVVVASASVIEGMARSTPCVQCGSELTLGDHTAEVHRGQSLRLTRLVCRMCHAPRALWFLIAPELAN
jgi:hypothetical protein